METNALSGDLIYRPSKKWCVYSRHWVAPWNVVQQSDRPGKPDPGFKVTAVWSAVQGRSENAFASETGEPCTKMRKCVATDFPRTVFGEPAGRRLKTFGVNNVNPEMSTRVKIGSRDDTRGTRSSSVVHGPGTTMTAVKVEPCDDDYATKPTRCADNHWPVTMSAPGVWLGSRAHVAQRPLCVTAAKLKSSVAAEISPRVKIESLDNTYDTRPSSAFLGTSTAVVKIEPCDDGDVAKPTRCAHNRPSKIFTPGVGLGSHAPVVQRSERPQRVTAEISARVKSHDNTYGTRLLPADHGPGTTKVVVKVESCDDDYVTKPTRSTDNHRPGTTSASGVGLGSRASVAQRSKKPLCVVAAKPKSSVTDDRSTRVKIEPCDDRDVSKQIRCADNRSSTMSTPGVGLGSGALVVQRSEKVVAEQTRCADNEPGTISTPGVRFGSHALDARRSRKRSHSSPRQLIAVPPPAPGVKPHPINASWKKVPKPLVVNVKAVAADAISLTWWEAAGDSGQYAAIKWFELYVFAEPLATAQPQEEASYAWRKMADLEATDPMPMKCVLVDCPVSRTHHLAMRAVDEYGRRAPFTFVKIAI